MTVAGILSPLVTVMPARGCERDMGETVRVHSAVVQWLNLLQLRKTCTSLPNTWVSLWNHSNTRTARTLRVHHVRTAYRQGTPHFVQGAAQSTNQQPTDKTGAYSISGPAI